MTVWSGDYRYQVGPADLNIHPNFNILLTFYHKSITIQIRERIFQCNDCGKDISDNSSDVCFFVIMLLVVTTNNAISIHNTVTTIFII